MIRRRSQLTRSITIAFATFVLSNFVNASGLNTAKINNGQQFSHSGIRHAFLVTGPITAIFDENSHVVWSLNKASRDGTVLPGGNILICHNKSVVEYEEGSTRAVWNYQLDPKNKETAAAFRLKNGNTLIVENGNWPRLLEISTAGTPVHEIPLQPETKNAHMQTRMARKLNNGHYIVPHLLAFSVKEYAPNGEIVQIIDTRLEQLGLRAKNWPFTAIKKDQKILVTLTNGNKIAIFNNNGQVAWQCNNTDLNDLFSDPCGAHWLPNDHIVVCNYGQKDPQKAKILEITPEKKVVWEFRHPYLRAHEVHIITTNNQKLMDYTK